ncbi:predicted protein [Naegleria gruberi]|uniref:Predicted protein n=1 Tax=Naegleria gruberi TaxID=5762 RepID=D2W392_NAEGR|nr:uncharacterized protein NAEGRDRAFT_82217 [Naegleria gruberi]EFC36473.1 predicted protein [Naegleria gruberi]|eukprot:XP_002669217.1 predicted protein [Naegleria gruberi strain NEG-M]
MDDLYGYNEDEKALQEFLAQKMKTTPTTAQQSSAQFNHQSSRNIFANSSIMMANNGKIPLNANGFSSSSRKIQLSNDDDDRELREYIAQKKEQIATTGGALNSQSSRNILAGSGGTMIKKITIQEAQPEVSSPSAISLQNSSSPKSTLNSQSSRNILSGVNFKPTPKNNMNSGSGGSVEISSSTQQLLDEHQLAFAEFLAKKQNQQQPTSSVSSAPLDSSSINTSSSRNILEGVDLKPSFRLIRDNSIAGESSKPKGILIREGSSLLVTKDILQQQAPPPPLVSSNSQMIKRGTLQRENSVFTSTTEKTPITEMTSSNRRATSVLQRENSLMIASQNPRGTLQRENSIMTSGAPRGFLQRENSVRNQSSSSERPRGQLQRENSVVTRSSELPRGALQRESSVYMREASSVPKQRPTPTTNTTQERPPPVDRGMSRNDQGYKQSINQRFLSKLKQRLEESDGNFSDTTSEISIRSTTDTTVLSQREICDEVGFTHQVEFSQLNYLVHQFVHCGFPVLVFDKLGSIEFLNKEAEDLFGVYSFSAMGEHVSELFLDDASVELHQAMYEFLGPTENSTLKADKIGSDQNYLDDIKPYSQLSEEEKATRRKSLSEERYLRAKATMLKQFFIVTARIIPIKKLQEIHFCVYLKFFKEIDNEHQAAVTNSFKHAITDLSIIPVITINDKGIIQVFNKAASSTFGYEPKEIVGRNVKIICNSRDRLKHDSYLDRCRSRENGVVDVTRKVKGETKSGKIISLEIKISQIVTDGKPSYVAYLRDYKSLSTPEEHMTRIAEKIFPKSIAERLSMGQTVIDTIDSCSMLYCDMVGFTDFSSRKSPKDVVKILHDIFTLFDNVCTELNLEKIKTIGDCYFVASGLSKSETNHADNIVKGGLAMIRNMKQYTTYTNTDHLLSVRLGIHTGNDVIAAVVGKVKRTYDLFGPAVEIAQMMEATGKVNQVHISNSTYKELRSEKSKSLFSENLMKGEEIALDKYSSPINIPLDTWITQSIYN